MTNKNKDTQYHRNFLAVIEILSGFTEDQYRSLIREFGRFSYGGVECRNSNPIMLAEWVTPWLCVVAYEFKDNVAVARSQSEDPTLDQHLLSLQLTRVMRPTESWFFTLQTLFGIHVKYLHDLLNKYKRESCHWWKMLPIIADDATLADVIVFLKAVAVRVYETKSRYPLTLLDFLEATRTHVGYSEDYDLTEDRVGNTYRGPTGPSGYVWAVLHQPQASQSFSERMGAIAHDFREKTGGYVTDVYEEKAYVIVTFETQEGIYEYVVVPVGYWLVMDFNTKINSVRYLLLPHQHYGFTTIIAPALFDLSYEQAREWALHESRPVLTRKAWNVPGLPYRLNWRTLHSANWHTDTIYCRTYGPPEKLENLDKPHHNPTSIAHYPVSLTQLGAIQCYTQHRDPVHANHANDTWFPTDEDKAANDYMVFLSDIGPDTAFTTLTQK